MSPLGEGEVPDTKKGTTLKRTRHVFIIMIIIIPCLLFLFSRSLPNAGSHADFLSNVDSCSSQLVVVI